jgi:tellurite resistance protein
MKPNAMIQKAARDLRARFDLNEYNPTPIVDLGALVANADGSVDPEEIEALCQLLEPMLGTPLNAEIVGYLVEASLKVIEAAGVEPRVRLIAEILMDCDAVEEGLIIALAVAHASAGLSAAERSIIESLARAAELPESRLDELNEEVRAALATP